MSLLQSDSTGNRRFLVALTLSTIYTFITTFITTSGSFRFSLLSFSFTMVDENTQFRITLFPFRRIHGVFGSMTFSFKRRRLPDSGAATQICGIPTRSHNCIVQWAMYCKSLTISSSESGTVR